MYPDKTQISEPLWTVVQEVCRYSLHVFAVIFQSCCRERKRDICMYEYLSQLASSQIVSNDTRTQNYSSKCTINYTCILPFGVHSHISTFLQTSSSQPVLHGSIRALPALSSDIRLHLSSNEPKIRKMCEKCNNVCVI